MPKLIQYQQKAQVPPASGTNSWLEKTTPDKWIGNTMLEPPTSNWKKAALYSCAAVMPYLAFTNVFPPLSGAVYTQNATVIASQPMTQYQRQAFVPVVSERITVDKWYQQPNQPIFKTPNTTYTYPVSVQDEKAMTLPERSTPDKWLPQKPDFIYQVTRTQYLYSYTPFVPLVKEIITVDKWQPPTNQPQLKAGNTTYTYPASVQDVNAMTAPERTTPDRWMGDTTQQPPLANWQQAAKYSCASEMPYLAFTNVYPTIAPIIQQQNVHIQYPRTFQYQSQTFVSVITERVTIDKWYQNTNQPRFDIQRNQYLYQTFTIDTNALTKPERTTPDRWLGYHPDFVFDIKRSQYLYSSTTFVSTVEKITVDKWFQPTQQPILTIKNLYALLPYGGQTLTIIAPIITQVPQLSLIGVGT